jgi:LPS-assembly lipoprotein
MSFVIRLICLIGILLPMVGCGFHLRGYSLLAPAMHVVYVRTASPYSGLYSDLRQNFCALGVRVTNNACQAPVTLHILTEKIQQDRITISATSLLSQYLLAYEVDYQLEDSHGCLLVARRKIRVTRNYTVNANQILGASNELPLLRQDMRREVVYQLINQLSSACVREAL